ncbi:microtubule-associated protein futsch isoform X1 [Neodiprion lecontei]|uniref:Microtubule-associated protein futsch isoform X1 n=2 Tax=Neodiprion lecontei TaxID=441921 RepID=A0ABM3FYZ1_NEOLC|nr:microtubule-associated protein futsch isoform X1 [Neodiprion lecontei]XP_046593241.1 microtubule-associated protein futsch isoform X1 [Neodiprion lecontei]
MSDGGTDNPAFSNDEGHHGSDNSNSTLENSHTESLQNSQITVESDYRTPIDEASSAATSQKVDNGHRQSFVSQHYVEPVRTSPEPQYKTETRIELPADNQEKLPSATKSNGVHGNGNNNDASFLNTSAASIQSNDGKKEQVEAVNLELVSMRPYNGANAQSKGQEACEVPADPYEEYFVPVNEHRKYISRSPDAEVETTVAGVRFDLGPGLGREGLSLRDPTAGLVDYSHWRNALRGEKLYVTKDKRSRSSYWRRIVCWGCGLLVLAIAIIIAILAATGVILTQEETQPLESDGHTSSRQFGDIKTSGSQEYMRNPPVSPPPEASTLPPWQTTDETLYETVPKAFDGLLTLDNFNWTEGMDNPKSRVYRDVSQEIEENLKEKLHLVANLSVVKVYNISRNGEVKFRISYPPVPAPEQMRNEVEKTLQETGSMVGKYHLSKLDISRLIDDCKHGEMNCSDSCRYDYSEGVFVCSCLNGKVLEADGTSCRDENDLSNVDMNEDISHVHGTEGYAQDGVQGRSRGHETTFSPIHQELDNSQAVPVEMDEPHITSEMPTMHEHHHETVYEPDTVSEPEPTGEPKSEPEPNLESEPKVEPIVTPKSEPEPTSEPKAEPEPTSEPEAEPVPSVEPEPVFQPKAEPEPSVEPEPSSEPNAEPEPSVEPEPSSEPNAEPVPSVEPVPVSEPKVETESSVQLEPTSEPSVERESMFKPKVEPEPSVEPEPTSEPKAEPEPSVESEPKFEPKAEPEPTVEPEPATEPKSEPQAKSEPAPEPKVTVAEHEPDTTTAANSTTKLVEPVEPVSEPQPSVEPEPENTLMAEPKVEPVANDEIQTESILVTHSRPESDSPSVSSDHYNTVLHTNVESEEGTPSSTEYSQVSGDSAGAKSQSTVDGNSNADEKWNTLAPTSMPEAEKEFEGQTEHNLTSGKTLQAEENSESMKSDNQTEPILPFSNITPIHESQPSQNEPEHNIVPSVDSIYHLEGRQGMNNETSVMVPQNPAQFENVTASGADVEHNLRSENNPEVTQAESSTAPVNDLALQDDLVQHFVLPSESQSEAAPVTESKENSTVSHAPATQTVQSGESENKTETVEKFEQPQGVSGATIGESRSKAIPDYDSFLDSVIQPTSTPTPIRESIPVIELAEEPESESDSAPFFTATIKPSASVEPERVNTSEKMPETMVEAKSGFASEDSNSKSNSSMVEPSLTTMNDTGSNGIDGIPSTSSNEQTLPETTEYNVIENMPKTVYQILPKLLSENVEPLIEANKNVTSSDDQHIMVIANTESSTEHSAHSIIPELSPEQIASVHSTENSIHNDSKLDDVAKINEYHPTENIDHTETLQNSPKQPSLLPENSMVTEHPSYPVVFAENSVEHSADKGEFSDEKHVENMSPYLPDIQHEKEISKKAPRLDKDEQDEPNPFDAHIPDVIAHHSEESGNKSKLQSDSSNIYFNGALNEVREHLNDTDFELSVPTKINNETQMHQVGYSVEDVRNQEPVIMSGVAVENAESSTQVHLENNPDDTSSEDSNNLQNTDNTEEVSLQDLSNRNGHNQSVSVIDNGLNEHHLHVTNESSIEGKAGQASKDEVHTDAERGNEPAVNSSIHSEGTNDSEEILSVIPLEDDDETSDNRQAVPDSENESSSPQNSEKKIIEGTTETANISTSSKEISNTSSDTQKPAHSEKVVVDYTERIFEDHYNDIVDENESNLAKHFGEENKGQNINDVVDRSNTSASSNAQNTTVVPVQSDVDIVKNNQTLTEQSTEHNEISHSSYTDLNERTPVQNTREQVSTIPNNTNVEADANTLTDHTEITTVESISDTQTTILPEIINGHSNEAKLTTEIPILPLELERMIPVTETVLQNDETTTTEKHHDQQTNDTNTVSAVLGEGEKSATVLPPPIFFHGSSLEGNATTQVPIMPDELQTTENEIFTTSTPAKILQSEEKLMDHSINYERGQHEHLINNNSQVNQEEMGNDHLRNIQNTSIPVLHLTTESQTLPSVQDGMVLINVENTNATENGNLYPQERTETVEDSTQKFKPHNETEISQPDLTGIENVKSTNSEYRTTILKKLTPSIPEETEMQQDKETKVTTQSPMITTDDIRPVSEAVVDDVMPYKFDYKQLFTPTGKPKFVEEDEPSEDELRVIPLEKQDVKKKAVEKKTLDKYKYKKEKELSFQNIGNLATAVAEDRETPTTTMLSVEIPPAIITEIMINEPSVQQEENSTRQTLVNTSGSPRTIVDNIEPNIPTISEAVVHEMTLGNNKSETLLPRTDSEIHVMDNENNTHVESLSDIISPEAKDISKNSANIPAEETIQNSSTSSNIPSIETKIGTDSENRPEIESNQNASDTVVLIQNNPSSTTTRSVIDQYITKINDAVPEAVHIEENLKQHSSTDTLPVAETTVAAPNPTSDVQNNDNISKIETTDNVSSNHETFLTQSTSSSEASIDSVTKGENTYEVTEKLTTTTGSIEIPVSIIESVKLSTGGPIELPNPLFSKCAAGQFQCVNGTSKDSAYCVSLAAKCDSENDCSDGSDEFNCEKEGCPGNFQCSSGQCLKRNLVCNGIEDCDDGSDEKSCQEWKCQFDEFQCPNGRCIPILWQCNGRPDCEDHRDEYSCAESCGNDEYLCPTEKWCIPLTWHCNGIPECAHGEDEKLCDCALDQFKCQTGGCVPVDLVCDGVEHCPDHSDEWDCLTANLTVGLSAVEIQKEEDDHENHGDSDLIGRATILKIKQPNGERRVVCADNWTTELSDAFCRTQGYFSSEATDMIASDEGLKLLKLKSTADLKAPFVTNFEQTDICETGKIVQISCEEFSCGSHYPEGPTARLAGGTPAGEGQWSSVALLKERKHGIACTASVLSPMYALASYSCVHKYRQSNGWQLFTGSDMLIPHAVKSIVPYPQVKYNQFLYNNDMTLVELEEPLVFSRNVSAVCLPQHPIQPRQLCVTAGWGFPMNGEVNLQQYLKFLPVPTYDSEECNATSHYAGFITKDNICAGFTDTDKGPCYNDEGAPLMCASETGRWELQGLLSHHSRCSRGHPAIYSSLAPAVSWLHHSVPALQTRP